MKNYFYITQNRGAGIGHQVCNYFSALVICELYDLQLVYTPFTGTSAQFEDVLSFSSLYELDYAQQKYCFQQKPEAINKKINKPEDIFSLTETQTIYNLDLNLVEDSNIFNELLKNKDNKQLLLKLYKKHKNALQPIYHNRNPYTTNNNLILHIRRGDAIGIPGRILPISYFYNAIKQIVSSQTTQYNIYIASQSNVEDLSMLDEFAPISLINKPDIEIFNHMINADIVVGSPSGFSHLAYILGQGEYYRSPKDWVIYDTDVKDLQS
jgi:ADP-heptose:LPS heptosyltransferase